MIRLIVLLCIAMLGLAGTASARPEGFRAYDFETDANVRIEARCRLTIDGDDVHDGRCDLARQPEGRVTVIDTLDGRKYRIVRDEFDKTQAKFYAGRRLIDDSMQSRGACWVGDSVRYCAK